MLEHFRSIYVLPPALTDIYGTDFVIARHRPNSISETAIAISLTAFEIVEDFLRTNEQAVTNSILFPQIFPNPNPFFPPCLNFHRFSQTKNEPGFPTPRIF